MVEISKSGSGEGPGAATNRGYSTRPPWAPKPGEILPHPSPDAPSFMGRLCRPVEPLLPGSACAITV
jgi:hypothetical protein